MKDKKACYKQVDTRKKKKKKRKKEAPTRNLIQNTISIGSKQVEKTL